VHDPGALGRPLEALAAELLKLSAKERAALADILGKSVEQRSGA